MKLLVTYDVRRPFSQPSCFDWTYCLRSLCELICEAILKLEYIRIKSRKVDVYLSIVAECFQLVHDN